MKETIRKLNRQMRLIVFVCGGIFALLELVQKKTVTDEKSRHGYQTEEFDDIW